MSNFTFLKMYENEPFFQYAESAEQNLYTDSNLTLSRCRQLSEVLAKNLAVQHNVSVGFNPNYQDLIDILTTKLSFSQKISQSFHLLRKSGNKAIHHGENDLELAKKSLKITHELMTWFHLTYGKADINFEPKPFVFPLEVKNKHKQEIIESTKPVFLEETSFKDIKPLPIEEVISKVETEKLKQQKIEIYHQVLVNNRFLKFDLTNNLLPPEAEYWAIILDTFTGLMWATNWNVDDDFPIRGDLTWFQSSDENCQNNLVSTYNDGNNIESWSSTINHHGWGGFNDWQISKEAELIDLPLYLLLPSQNNGQNLWSIDSKNKAEKGILLVKRQILEDVTICPALKQFLLFKQQEASEINRLKELKIEEQETKKKYEVKKLAGKAFNYLREQEANKWKERHAKKLQEQEKSRELELAKLKELENNNLQTQLEHLQKNLVKYNSISSNTIYWQALLDKTTNLMWANSGNNNEFPVVRLDWYNAETIIQEMNTQQWAGFNDWRLPTVKELFVLSRQIKTMKDRYHLLFSDEKEKCCFWSSTVDENNQYKAWCVNFSHYTGYTDIKDYRYYVRAVRLS